MTPELPHTWFGRLLMGLSVLCMAAAGAVVVVGAIRAMVGR